MPRFILATIAAALLIAEAASAQTFSYDRFAARLNDYALTRSTEARRLAGKAPMARVDPARMSPVQARAALSFSPRAAPRRAAEERAIASLRRGDPTAVTELRRQLKRNFWHDMRLRYRHYGLDNYNLVDVISTYLVNVADGMRGDGRDPDRAFVNAVRRQVAMALIGAPALRRSAEARQILAEESLFRAGLIDDLVRAQQGNPAALAEVRRRIIVDARDNYHFDARTLREKPSGF